MRICVNKRVSWQAGDRRITGKVLQVLGDHVRVESNGMNYIVLKSVIVVDPDQGRETRDECRRTGTTS